MNEINLNPLSRSAGISKPSNPPAIQKNANLKTNSLEADSTQFSKLPDLSAVEESIEKEFEGLRSNLEADADSPSYPPLEVIDRLAVMLAVNLDRNTGGPLP